MSGDSITSLPTPALLLDLDALEHNIARMAGFFRGRACGLRPHFKSHKCTRIAKMQLAAGACGITCATLAEAEGLVAAGVSDTLIANEIVGEPKIAWLMGLARECDLSVAVDSAANVVELSRAAQAAGIALRVLVEIDIGLGRCGVAPGRPALDLAREIEAAPALRFEGLMAYEGHTVLLPDPEERRAKTLEALARAVDTRRLIESAGLPVHTVSSGGTGTYDITGAYPGIDEVQAGSYATMDCCYAEIRPEFRQAISVLATIISRPRPGVAVLDAGVKSIGAEFGPPHAWARDPQTQPHAAQDRAETHARVRLYEEHCALDLPESAGGVGDVIELVPSHGCTTCNLYRNFVVHRNGQIIDFWPIDG